MIIYQLDRPLEIVIVGLGIIVQISLSVPLARWLGKRAQVTAPNPP
jgi:hypothetical protein